MQTRKTSAHKASKKLPSLQTLYKQLSKTLAEIATHPDSSPQICRFLMDLAAYATGGEVGTSIKEILKRKQ